MNYYIFRHGQTHHTKTHIPYGDEFLTAEIIPDGVPAIKRLAEYVKKLPIDAAYSSPFKRCRQTVEIVAPITGLKFVFDERLGDYMDTEPMDKFTGRIKSFVDEVKKSGLENILICTHGYPISAFIQYVTNGEIDNQLMKNYPVPGVLVEIKNSEVKYLDFNQQATHSSDA